MKDNTTMTDTLPSLEKLTPNVTCEWLYERQIIIFTNTSPTAADIDVYINTLTTLTLQWDTTRPFLVMHDYTNAPYTPYARERVEQYFKLIPPDLWGRSVAVLPPTIVGNLMRFFAQKMMKQHHPKFELRYFNSRAEGLAWLKGGLENK